jgi:putative endonuclease
MLLLIFKGYRILAHRLRTPFGEVDILAQKGAALVAVEVKNRKGQGMAAAALLPEQKGRLQRAALFHAGRLNPAPESIRLDAVLFEGLLHLPRHLKNVAE